MKKSIKLKIFGWVALLTLLVATPIIASQIGDLITFQNGEVADANQVNQNFSDLKNAVNDLQAQLNALSSQPGSIVAAIKVDSDGSINNQAPFMKEIVVTEAQLNDFKIEFAADPNKPIDVKDYHIMVTPIGALFTQADASCHVLTSVVDSNLFDVKCLEVGSGTLKAVPYSLLIIKGDPAD